MLHARTLLCIILVVVLCIVRLVLVLLRARTSLVVCILYSRVVFTVHNMHTITVLILATVDRESPRVVLLLCIL